MLTLIRIANYAIIDEVEVEFAPGFSVMTGETGAGKSILVDALGLALGDRADSGAVRQGAKRAEISVVFEIPETHSAHAWLCERDLEVDGGCTVRRTISAEGRSRAMINNQPVTLEDLRALGAMLIDIHDQHAHQSLLDGPTQRIVLDSSAGLTELAGRVAAAYRSWQDVAATLREKQERSADNEAQLELLRFQHAELKELALEAGEVEQLYTERGRLANVDRLLQGLDSALNQIYDSDLGSAYSQVAQARRTIAELIEHDPELKKPSEQLGLAEIELRDVAASLSRHRDRLEADPLRLEYLDTRLARIRTLARRHRVEEAELVDVAARIDAAIEKLDSGEQSLEELTAEAERNKRTYLDLAGELSRQRHKGAVKLGKQVSIGLKELGLPHAEFRAELERKSSDRADATGIDRIEFQVQLNPGQPFAAISRVASGGELSRISLALEVVVTDASTIPTFVFDEVDAGVGGGVAEIVGRRLRQVARQRQVLCVTHLPQVASQGEQHYRVIKITDGKSSRTQVRELSADLRIEELSRMLGGVKITARTRAHAEEMIRSAAEAAS
jgi:DNA repair protein RecN (Recombination protein N)